MECEMIFVKNEEDPLKVTDENVVEAANASTSSTNSSIICELCQRTTIYFKSKNISNVHCQICKKKLRNTAHNLWMKRMKELYSSCLICVNIFYNRLSYEKHDCTLEGTFVCDGCCRIYLQKEKIETHVQKCKKIISKFMDTEHKQIETKSKTQLKSHVNAGTSGLINSNNIKTYSKSMVNMSNQSDSSDKSKCFSCNFCTKTFRYNCRLIRHMLVHTREKPFKCKFCNKMFRQTNHLSRHVRLHTGEKPYTCKFCNKVFTRSDNLTDHVRLHTGEGPYKCKFCKKKFVNSSSLITHVRFHTGERLCKCNFCNKVFSRSCDLTKHVRIHTGERPYKCKLCGKMFAERSSLNKHLRVHSRERPYKCVFCKKIFSSSSNLTVHLRVHI